MNECRDRKSRGVGAAKVLGILLPGAKVPGSEGSQGTFAPRSESSRERKFLELSFPGAKVPGNESSREQKFHIMVLSLPWAKVLRNESSIIHFILAVTWILLSPFLDLSLPNWMHLQCRFSVGWYRISFWRYSPSNVTHTMRVHWLTQNSSPIFHQIKYTCTEAIAVCNIVFRFRISVFFRRYLWPSS